MVDAKKLRDKAYGKLCDKTYTPSDKHVVRVSDAMDVVDGLIDVIKEQQERIETMKRL